MNKEKSWELLTFEEKVSVVDMLSNDSAIAVEYNVDQNIITDFRQLRGKIPNDKESTTKTHNPPKGIILSARRDLNFREANYELIDNSIDKWVVEGKTHELVIDIEYNLDQNTGIYTDNAGGFEPDNVYKVFIPGETGNDDFTKPVIGSFAMGAKKAIFRLSSGARVISSKTEESGCYCFVEQGWEFTPDWDTKEGICESIGKGVTKIFFVNLNDPPDEDQIDQLREGIAVTYYPILCGWEYERNHQVIIKVNGIPIEGKYETNLAYTPGAEPRIYQFKRKFHNPISAKLDDMIEIQARLFVGLKRSRKDTGDFGIDVFGNGRRFDTDLKAEFGYGKRNLSAKTQANQFLKGFLSLTSHSVLIPWDTHKREYQGETEVARWLEKQISPIIKAYNSVVQYATASDRKELSHEVLRDAELPEDFEPEVIEATSSLPNTKLVKELWKDLQKVSNDCEEDSDDEESVTEDVDNLASQDDEDDFTRIELILETCEIENLCARFGLESEEFLADTIKAGLLEGVYIPLEKEVFQKACEIFNCPEDPSELSLEVYQSLISLIEESS